MDNLLVLNVVGTLVGIRSSSRETVNDSSFPSLISSCSGFKGSLIGFPNTSSTVATTLPALQVQSSLLIKGVQTGLKLTYICEMNMVYVLSLVIKYFRQ